MCVSLEVGKKKNPTRISGVANGVCLQPRVSAAGVSPVGSEWADIFKTALKFFITSNLRCGLTLFYTMRLLEKC